MSTDVFVDFRDAAFTYDGEAFVFRHLEPDGASGAVSVPARWQRLGGSPPWPSTSTRCFCPTRARGRVRLRHPRRRADLLHPLQRRARLPEPRRPAGGEPHRERRRLRPGEPRYPERAARAGGRALAEVGLQGFEAHETSRFPAARNSAWPSPGARYGPGHPHPGRGHGHARPARARRAHARCARATSAA